MTLNERLQIPENVNAALTTGEKEEISIIVPANLIHFELELFFGSSLVSLYIDERHQVLLVTDSNRMTIRRPTYIDVLS